MLSSTQNMKQANKKKKQKINKINPNKNVND